MKNFKWNPLEYEKILLESIINAADDAMRQGKYDSQRDIYTIQITGFAVDELIKLQTEKTDFKN